MMNQQAFTGVLRQFARTMSSDYDVSEALQDLSYGVADVLEASGVGVALLDGDDLRFVTATNETAREAERIQERLQSGPCVTSIDDNKPVPVDDLGQNGDRWPDYSREATAIGVRGVLGLPLVLDDRRVGSLDVYSAEPRRWSDEVIDVALTLADIGAAYVLSASQLARSERTAEQLQTALNSRVVIEQAKGVLAARLGISMAEAFERLRNTARRESTKVANVAQRVIDTDYIPN